MPCTVPSIPYDHKLAKRIVDFNHEVREQADRAMHSLDNTRECILGNREWPLSRLDARQVAEQVRQRAEGLRSSLSPPYESPMPSVDFEMVDILTAMLEEEQDLVERYVQGSLNLAEVEMDQVVHRKRDIVRLIKFFADKGDLEEVGRLLTIDPRKFLEPQLGYDPDRY